MNIEGEINEVYKIAKTLNICSYLSCPRKPKEKTGFKGNQEVTTFSKWLQKAGD